MSQQGPLLGLTLALITQNNGIFEVHFTSIPVGIIENPRPCWPGAGPPPRGPATSPDCRPAVPRPNPDREDRQCSLRSRDQGSASQLAPDPHSASRKGSTWRPGMLFAPAAT